MQGIHEKKLQMKEIEWFNFSWVFVRKKKKVCTQLIFRKVYWADKGGKTVEPKVAVMNMDGSGPRTLHKRRAEVPEGLAMDRSNKDLYWSDSGQGWVWYFRYFFSIINHERIDIIAVFAFEYSLTR